MDQIPILTICVPSRNRQKYFQKTILSLVTRSRADIEFVFADNSDDGSIMQGFMAQFEGHKRIVFLPSQPVIFSAQDNFERVCDVASGQFVTVIGDDDYIDTDLADLLNILATHRSDIDCVAWSRPVYKWPEENAPPLLCAVELNNNCLLISKNDIQKRAYFWDHHTAGLPNYPFSIYHGAVSKQLMNSIKARYHGRHFENPVPDIEYGLKLALEANIFVYSQRPFSIAGICPESNGYSFGNIKKIKEIQARFAKELGRVHEKDDYLSDFPFPSYLGNSVILAQVHLWFRKAYKIGAEGWQSNFAAACAVSCTMMQTLEDYEIMVAEFTKAFETWEGGRHLKDFQPGKFSSGGTGIGFIGVYNLVDPVLDTKFHFINILDNVNGAQTPSDFFDVIRSIVTPVEDIYFHPNTMIPNRGWNADRKSA